MVGKCHLWTRSPEVGRLESGSHEAPREGQILVDLTTLFSWRVLLPASGMVNTKGKRGSQVAGLEVRGRQPGHRSSGLAQGQAGPMMHR